VLHRLLLCAALLLPACTDFGGPISGGGARALPPGEQRLQAIETRLADVTRRVENLNLAAQSQELSRLEADLRNLRGEVEALQNSVTTAERRNRDLYQDLDRRLQRLEAASQPARLSLEPRISNAPAAPPSQEEESTYLRVFDQLKNQRYDDAIAGFRDMLARWPQGRYAENAWYWMGEAYFIKRDAAAAQQSFQNLLERFPQGAKVPDALYRLVEIHVEQQRTDAARQTYDRLLKDHPTSSAASKARQKFEQLR